MPTNEADLEPISSQLQEISTPSQETNYIEPSTNNYRILPTNEPLFILNCLEESPYPDNVERTPSSESNVPTPEILHISKEGTNASNGQL